MLWTSLEGSDFRLEEVRKRFASILEKIPAQSPKRRLSVDSERNALLLEIGKLSQAYVGLNPS